MTKSYEDFGGVPEQVRGLVAGAMRAIDFYVDRPENEKDILMAATALYFATDMTVYKQLPDNIAEYDSAIKQILEDALANPTKSYSASRDLMQIGLALAIPMKGVALSALRDTREKIEEIAAEDPKLLKRAIYEMTQAIKKGTEDGALYFTGEQPRLEAEARKVTDAIMTSTEELIEYMNSLLAPPSGTARKTPPAPPQ